MKKLIDCKDKIHSCSKCGLCQSVCPIYKITGNDCTVSRGHFVMLRGLINGELKMTKTINKYLNMCLKCGACSDFCPSDIDVVDIIALAKAEFFKSSTKEKLVSYIMKTFVFGLGLNLVSLFQKRNEGKTFDRKVIYFGGCRGKVRGNKSVVKLLNACGIEVITPDFNCCGIPFFVRGDMETFRECAEKFDKIMEKHGVTDVVTTCASCEKTIKSYSKWFNQKNYSVKNIFEYLKDSEAVIKLKHPVSVTFHKPCNMTNFSDVLQIMKKTENLNYIPMQDYDKCCGFNGVAQIKNINIITKILQNKKDNILASGAKIVLTSCPGCELGLKLFSFGKYKVKDFTEFLAQNAE